MTRPGPLAPGAPAGGGNTTPEPPLATSAHAPAPAGIAARVLVLGWAALVVVFALEQTPGDLAALYIAGQMWSEAGPSAIYAFEPHDFFLTREAGWLSRAEALGLDLGGLQVFPYVYPPVWAALMAPVASALPFHVVTSIAAVVFLVPFAFSVFAARRLMAARASPVGYAVATLLPMLAAPPFLVAIWNLQPHFLISALVVVALERGRPGLGPAAALAAGVALGLAAAIKLSPAFLALWWAVCGRWRPLGAMAATAGGIALLSVLTLGWDIHSRFLERLGEIDALVLANNVNGSLERLLFGLFGDLETVTPLGSAPEPGWIGAVVLGVLVLGTAGILALARGAGPIREAAAPLALLQLSILCGPLAWPYYALPMLLCLAGLPAMLGPRAGFWAAVGLWFLAALPILGFVPGLGWTAAIPPSTLFAAFPAAALGVCVAALARSALARRVPIAGRGRAA